MSPKDETRLVRTTMWVGVLQQFIKYAAFVLIVYILWLAAIDLGERYVTPVVHIDEDKQLCVVVQQQLFCKRNYGVR